jgi:LAO/AO transport system kinase
VVIVETVGVGQSETAVAGMTDLFVLLQLPNAGDDLQAIKKGVMELADLVVINKADIDEAAATRARAQITSALRLMGLSHAVSRYRCCNSARCRPRAWRLSGKPCWPFMHHAKSSGQLQQRRQAQEEAWMWERVLAGLRQRFHEHPAVRAALPG